jgi:MFS family permease
MLSTISSIYSLLLSIAILLLGSGLLGTTLSIRAGMEAFPQGIIGIIMAAFFLGYVIGSYLCPRLISRVGHIRAFAVLAAFGSVSVIIHGLVIDPLVWWLLRIVTGICMVGLYLVVESWLNSLLVPRNRGRIFAVYVTVTLLALGSSQFLFLIYGANELATFALCAIFFSLALVPIAVTRLAPPAHVAVPKLILRRLLKVSPLGVAGAFTTGLGSGALWGLGPLYAAASFDQADSGVALFMGAVVFGGALLQWPIGHQSDARDRRRVLMVVCFLSAASAFGVYLFGFVTPGAMLASAVLYGGFSFAVYSLAVAHTNDHIEPGEVLEATRGLLLLNGLGAATGPILAGYLMQLFGASVLLLYFVVLFGALGWLTIHYIRTTEPQATAAQSRFIAMARTGPAAVEMDPRSPLDELQAEHTP